MDALVVVLSYLNINEDTSNDRLTNDGIDAVMSILHGTQACKYYIASLALWGTQLLGQYRGAQR